MDKIILLGEPKSTNNIYQYVCQGHFPRYYMTASGKKVKENYVEQVRKQWKKKPLEDSIVLAIHIYFGTKRRCDIDNFNKLVWDSLTGVVWKDDSQVDELIITRYYDKENPRIELFINP